LGGTNVADPAAATPVLDSRVAIPTTAASAVRLYRRIKTPVVSSVDMHTTARE
jgi:hypothetical protein